MLARTEDIPVLRISLLRRRALKGPLACESILRKWVPGSHPDAWGNVQKVLLWEKKNGECRTCKSLSELKEIREQDWEEGLTLSSSSSLRWHNSLWCCSFICSMTSSASMLIFSGLHSSEPSPENTWDLLTRLQVLSITQLALIMES